MTQTYFAIDDGNGNQLTTGLSPYTACRTAQRLADERNESVYLYALPCGDDGDASEEIKPSEIEVDLGGPVGPRVTYGAQDEETVEAEIPEGWEVDWSNAVDISTSGTHRIRYAAPLVPDGLVTVEIMPDYLRESHRAARNWGCYPHNGAVRERVTRDEAEQIVASDPDGYASIVEGNSAS